MGTDAGEVCDTAPCPELFKDFCHVQENGSRDAAGVQPSCNVFDNSQELMVCREAFVEFVLDVRNNLVLFNVVQ